MASLVLNTDTHTYTVNGVEIPSVSELTRFLTREVYADVNQAAMDFAASRGTKVHKAAEALDWYGKVEVDDETLPYLKAYLNFLKEKKPCWLKIEWSVHSKEMTYAGTIDRYGDLDYKRVILDIKTTSRIDKNHKVLYTAAQNLYRMAIEEGCPVDALYILQLKKDGTYKLIELEIQDELANACITLHQAFQKKRKRKELETNDQE